MNMSANRTSRHMGSAMAMMIAAAVLLPGVSSANAQDVSAKLKAIHDKGVKTLAVVSFTRQTVLGGTEISGMGICIHRDSKGRAIFMTKAVGARVRPSDVTNVRIYHPGMVEAPLIGEYMGADGISGFQFVRTTTSVDWPRAAFSSSGALDIGSQVVSVGLSEPGLGGEGEVAMAYIRGKVSIPETLYRVSGGKLTGACSLVFDMKGNAVGVVGKQLASSYHMRTNRGATSLTMTGVDERSYFLPVEEFAHALRRIPTPTNPQRLAWLGVVNLAPVTPDTAELYNIKTPAVMLGRIVPAKAAGRAGLKERDLIVELNGKPLEWAPSPMLIIQKFLRRLWLVGPGKEITLTVVRGEERAKVEVILDPMPKEPFEADEYASTTMGMIIRDKVEMDRYTDRSPTAEVDGVFVNRIAPRSPAANSGIRQGDLITQVNGQDAKSVASLSRIVDAAEKDQPGKMITFTVRRGSESQDINVVPVTRP